MKTTTLSSQNQVTLPKFITNLLGIRPGDKILVIVGKQEITLKPLGKSLVDNLAGSVQVPKEKQGKTFQEIIKSTKQKTAQKLAKT